MACLVRTCRWCGNLIVHDPHGDWVHADRAYTCRDEWGTLLPSSAEPAQIRWTAVYRSASAR